MFYVLSKILDVFLSPLTWALVFLLLALPWRHPRRRLRAARRWRSRRGLGIAGLAVLVVFALDPVSNAMLYRLEHATESTYRDDQIYDAVVLLGGVTDERIGAETGQPSYNDNVERLVATHRLLAEGRARTVIISGAAVEAALVDSGEARVLGRQLVAWGIDPARIILEERARNTRENAVYSKRIADERGFEKVVIVTSAFHMRRAAECFAAVDMNVDRLIVDYRAHARLPRVALFPRAGNLAESERMLREFFGLYIYRARGYARPAR